MQQNTTSKMNRKTYLKAIQSLVMAAISLILSTGLINCGNAKTANLPTEFIQGFIAKHEAMIDPALAYYYVREEQESIAERIDTTVRIKKAEGTFDSVQQATFDFSEVDIQVIDQKEEYVNDEPVLFLKVAVKGDLCINLPTEQQKVKCDDIIIVEYVRNEWKITETQGPWS